MKGVFRSLKLALLAMTFIGVVPYAQALSNKHTLNQTTIVTPAAAVYNGKVFLAWTGTDSNHTLNIASSSDGVTFGGASFIGSRNTSFAGPGLASCLGSLFIAWGGGGNDINISSSTDGVTWPSQYFITAGDGSILRTISSVALGCSGDNRTLYLAYINQDANRTVVYSTTTDGLNWSAASVMGGTAFGSPWSPALTGGGGNLELYYVWISNQRSVPEIPGTNPGIDLSGLTGPPAITWGNNGWLFVADGPQYEAYSLNSPTCTSLCWTQVLNIANTGYTSNGNTALVYYNSHVFMYWAGTDSPSHLNSGQLY